MKYHVFYLPLYIDIPRKKKDKRVYLNLNTYRNLHHQINNQAKKLFRPFDKISSFKAKKIKVSYQVEKKVNRLYDLMNVVSIVDKFFLDWLVESEYIHDDNINHVEYGTIRGVKGSFCNCVIATVEVLE